MPEKAIRGQRLVLPSRQRAHWRQGRVDRDHAAGVRAVERDAALLVAGGLHLLAAPVDELVALYGGSFILRGLSLPGIALLAATGAALGWLGAALSLAIHLRRPG